MSRYIVPEKKPWPGIMCTPTSSPREIGDYDRQEFDFVRRLDSGHTDYERGGGNMGKAAIDDQELNSPSIFSQISRAECENSNLSLLSDGEDGFWDSTALPTISCDSTEMLASDRTSSANSPLCYTYSQVQSYTIRTSEIEWSLLSPFTCTNLYTPNDHVPAESETLDSPSEERKQAQPTVTAGITTHPILFKLEKRPVVMCHSLQINDEDPPFSPSALEPDNFFARSRKFDCILNREKRNSISDRGHSKFLSPNSLFHQWCTESIPDISVDSSLQRHSRILNSEPCASAQSSTERKALQTKFEPEENSTRRMCILSPEHERRRMFEQACSHEFVIVQAAMKRKIAQSWYTNRILKNVARKSIGVLRSEAADARDRCFELECRNYRVKDPIHSCGEKLQSQDEPRILKLNNGPETAIHLQYNSDSDSSNGTNSFGHNTFKNVKNHTVQKDAKSLDAPENLRESIMQLEQIHTSYLRALQHHHSLQKGFQHESRPSHKEHSKYSSDASEENVKSTSLNAPHSTVDSERSTVKEFWGESDLIVSDHLDPGLWIDFLYNRRHSRNEFKSDVKRAEDIRGTERILRRRAELFGITPATCLRTYGGGGLAGDLLRDWRLQEDRLCELEERLRILDAREERVSGTSTPMSSGSTGTRDEGTGTASSRLSNVDNSVSAFVTLSDRRYVDKSDLWW